MNDRNIYEWMKRGECGNVIRGLAFFYHEAGNGGNNVCHYLKHARTAFLPKLDSIILPTDESNIP